mgnify:CR=1 FL=1
MENGRQCEPRRDALGFGAFHCLRYRNGATFRLGNGIRDHLPRGFSELVHLLRQGVWQPLGHAQGHGVQQQAEAEYGSFYNIEFIKAANIAYSNDMVSAV